MLKLYDIDGKNFKKMQTNIEIFHVHELILLKYPYYPRQFIDSMQSVSKFQYNFFFKNKINIVNLE